MEINIHPSWKQQLEKEFEKEYFKELITFVNNQYKQTTCYPPFDLIFSAFNSCPFDAVKVVIIGQDPYHGFGQARQTIQSRLQASCDLQAE